MRTKLQVFIAVVMISAFAKAQISFSDATSLLNNNTLRSGVAMAITDMNGDALDDIIRLDNNNVLEIEYQQTDGTFNLLAVDPSNSSPWGLTIADVDENGYRDIILGGAYDELRFFEANDSGTAFSQDFLDGPGIFLQNANFADIDNDGAIDFFGCHDDGISSPYHNDGNGNLSYNLNLINAESTVNSDNSGNYGSIWTDYDNDGDIDLYISKCRGGVSDPMDGRRLNLLFQNDGNGNFTDVAETAGLRPMTQTWATGFDDIDNDGDYDAVVVNHFSNHQIFENNGDGTFTDITASSGISSALDDVGFGIQVMLEDFDNDGYIDILMTTTDGNHHLFQNDGDNTFTDVSNPFNTNGSRIQSAAVGDANNDGFVDVIAGYATGFTNPSSFDDQLFLNDGNDNNWSKVHLTGVESNVDGIGARIEIYGDWGMQVREIRAGESYGTQNSLMAHFGIGDATAIDEIIIKWPSGIVNTIEVADINETIFAVEGEDILGTDTFSLQNISALYPNPAQTHVNFTINNTTNYNNIDVYDMQGRKIQSQVIEQLGTQEVNVTSLSSGVYFLKIGNTSRKFIKQ